MIIFIVFISSVLRQRCYVLHRVRLESIIQIIFFLFILLNFIVLEKIMRVCISLDRGISFLFIDRPLFLLKIFIYCDILISLIAIFSIHNHQRAVNTHRHIHTIQNRIICLLHLPFTQIIIW